MRLLLLIVTLCLAQPLVAQDTDLDERKRRLAEISAGAEGNEEITVPELLPGVEAEAETRRKYHEALRAYYDYRVEGLEHRKKVFKWQLFSARLIFGIVIGVVTIGLVFAAIQFRLDMKRMAEGAARESPDTELEVSTSGFKVSSSILGVIILSLSLGFFYLYLVYVYPIEDIW